MVHKFKKDLYVIFFFMLPFALFLFHLFITKGVGSNPFTMGTHTGPGVSGQPVVYSRRGHNLYRVGRKANTQ